MSGCHRVAMVTDCDILENSEGNINLNISGTNQVIRMQQELAIFRGISAFCDTSVLQNVEITRKIPSSFEARVRGCGHNRNDDSIVTIQIRHDRYPLKSI